jgi:hypothetical protein
LAFHDHVEGHAMLEWTIEYLEEIDVIYVKTRGVLTMKNSNAMVQEIVAAMARHQCFKHIVDHRETEFTLTIADYYQRPATNEQIGLSHRSKIGMVFRELNEKTQFMETVFNNRGYNFRQFCSLEQAKAWMIEK